MMSIKSAYRIACLIAAIFPLTVANGQPQPDLAKGREFIHPMGRTNAAPRTALGPNGVETFHNGTTLLCSQCHVAHASKQHPLAGEPNVDPFGGYPQVGSPNRFLLKSPDPVTLCLACHDNQPGIPDVLGPDVNGLVNRAAGFFASLNQSNPAGHTLRTGLSVSSDDLCYRCHFGGTMATAAVTCIDCHNPHGNGKVRNLQWASWPGGEPDFGLFVAPGATGMAKYESANTAYGDPGNGVVREVTNMCIDCHHTLTGTYYNDPGGSGNHIRHPSYDSERSDPNSIAQGGSRGTTAPSHWVTGTGAGFGATPRVPFLTANAADFGAAHEVSAATNGVFCLSCHKAHGGANSFGLMWNPASGPGGTGCVQCHAMSES
jgi:hypothetical protein